MGRAGSILREARTRAGLSQRALASLAGVKQPVVSRIEAGREQPSLTTLERLVSACGYRLTLSLEDEPDAHDLGLMAELLTLSPQQRVDRLIALHRFARQLRRGVERGVVHAQ